MKNVLAISFAVLGVVSIFVWIGGVLTAAIVPWFGGIRAARIGEIGLTVGILGEGCLYAFGWLTKHLATKPNQKRPGHIVGLPGPKRYGNRKRAA